MKLVAAFGVAALFAGPAAAQTCHISPDKSLGHCVRIEARRLEPSGETSGDVATAAIDACQPVEQSILDLIVRCGVSASDRREIAAVAERGARSAAISVVVSIRAARHAH